MSKKFFIILYVVLNLWFPTTILANEDVYLGGESVGIEVMYPGVVVSDTYSFQIGDKHYDPSTYIHKFDIIIEVNNVKVQTIQQLQQQLQNYTDNKVNEIPIVVLRNQKKIQTKILYQYDPSTLTYKHGLYLKDRLNGIGTLTFIEPNSMRYGCLGHEIMDPDTKSRAEIDTGTIYDSSITSITKATPSTAGQKHASIDYQNILGSIDTNTPYGIFGTYGNDVSNKEKIELANINDIHKGKASICTVLSNQHVETYEIDIITINTHSKTKNLVFTITDKTLLNKTNGIIQGMSGSPIIQDGKLVGAVTHVVVNEPSRGFGIFIEHMMEVNE